MRSGTHGQTLSRLQMLKVAAVRLYLTEVFLSDTVTFSSFFSFNFINSLSHPWKTLVKKKADDRVNSRERPACCPKGHSEGLYGHLALLPILAAPAHNAALPVCFTVSADGRVIRILPASVVIETLCGLMPDSASWGIHYVQ